MLCVVFCNAVLNWCIICMLTSIMISREMHCESALFRICSATTCSWYWAICTDCLSSVQMIAVFSFLFLLPVTSIDIMEGSMAPNDQWMERLMRMVQTAHRVWQQPYIFNTQPQRYPKSPVNWKYGNQQSKWVHKH